MLKWLLEPPPLYPSLRGPDSSRAQRSTYAQIFGKSKEVIENWTTRQRIENLTGLTILQRYEHPKE